MIIETKLAKDQFFRLAVLRHFQRPTFYMYAFAAAALMAFAYVNGPLYLMLVGMVPFLLYIAMGVFSAWRDSRDTNQPYFLATRYEFGDRGVLIKTLQGQSELGWDQFEGWKMMVEIYVLFLSGGAIIAIPKSAVPKHQVEAFEGLLNRKIA